jgi:hypothetical protein
LAKKFHLSKQAIRPIVSGLGACIATDRITVDGAPVGYMYRERPDNDSDSGWRFLAGDESQAYMDEPDNHGVFDLNTIANYDGDVVQYLYALPGARFERGKRGAPLVEAPDSEPDANAKVRFPVVQGPYALTKTWSIELGGPFWRRVEDGSLVLWRPCLTMFFTALEASARSPEARVDELRGEISKAATEVVVRDAAGFIELSYRLAEDSEDDRLPALYAFLVAPAQELTVAAYFDREVDHVAARKALHTVKVR